MKQSALRPWSLYTLAACALALMNAAPAAEWIPLKELAQRTHFHGIGVRPGDREHLWLATHHGVFQLSLDGRARRVSADGNDYMGFTPHPSQPDTLFASGHPQGGGNLGFITSQDGGRTWKQLSPGLGGPVDFHQMDVSRADPQVIYGVFRGVQVSRDGGRNWTLTGQPPEGLIDLAASGTDVNGVFAATRTGLHYSADAGATWRPAHPASAPVTLVQAGPGGEVYVFILGLGFMKAAEPGTGWQALNNAFGDGYLLHLAVDAADPMRLFAVGKDNVVFRSGDGGVTWAVLGAGG